MLPCKFSTSSISLCDIKYFEKFFFVSVNIYGYDHVPYPFYISEYLGKPFHVDLLLHNGLYYLITNMSSFVLSCSKTKSKEMLCVPILSVLFC